MKRKNIGVLNFQYSNHNYGAVLQAAALESILIDLGHNAIHIDFMALAELSPRMLAGKILRKIGLTRRASAGQMGNSEAFERFRVDFLQRTERITTSKEFARVSQQLDAVVVGSDQVWRPALSRDPVAFFLGYVPEGVDRVAYAASFGNSWWEESQNAKLTEQVKIELEKFKAISCREISGVTICRETFGIDAVHVLDPLLLVNDNFFERIMSKSLGDNKNKIVHYKLDSDSNFNADIDELGRRYNSTSVNIYHNRLGEEKFREVSEWLSSIYNAEVVITDSFHCICLALRFDKEIIYCPNNRRGQARLDSLFEMFDITIEPTDLASKTPMYRLSKQNKFNSILKAEKKKSNQFLLNAIGE